jgi:pyrroloquinoline quinone (PQQ) biosynthesis protein C
MESKEFVQNLDRELEPLRSEIVNSKYVQTLISGGYSMKQFIELMKQRYAFLRENPYILASWIQACPDREIRDIYIDYLHEETPHPEYLIGFAKEAGVDPQEFLDCQPIPELGAHTYYYYWLSKGHIVEIAAANNFGSEGVNKRYSKEYLEAVKKYYGGYPSLVKLQDEHHEEEGGHSNIGRYVLEKYAVTEALQKKAAFAAKQVLKIKIRSLQALHEMVQAVQ